MNIQLLGGQQIKQSYIQFYLWIPQEVAGGKGKWVVDGSRAWGLAEQATENGYLGARCGAAVAMMLAALLQCGSGCGSFEGHCVVLLP